MNLSFSTRGWPGLSWDEMMNIAEEMGFSGIEVYNLPKFAPDRPQRSLPQISDRRHCAAAAGKEAVHPLL